jgi:hypothetical protein
MLIDTLNKILFVLFFLSCLNVIRHTYFFIQTWFLSTDEEPVKYTINSRSIILLGVSISYILTVILTGIKI